MTKQIMNTSTTERVHISEISHGDCIEVNGKLMTIDRKYIKRCDFMGTTIMGDNYRWGTTLITRMLFPYYRNGRLFGYRAQN